MPPTEVQPTEVWSSEDHAARRAPARPWPWRRSVLALALLLVLGAGASWAVRLSLGTCEPLDRLLGRSGCVATHRIEGFWPSSIRALVPASGATMRVFGLDTHAEGAVAWQPVQVAFDVTTGVETPRGPLPFDGHGLFVAPSLDGTTVVVAEPPVGQDRGPHGVVLDVASGAIVAQVSGKASVRRLMSESKGAPWSSWRATRCATTASWSSPAPTPAGSG